MKCSVVHKKLLRFLDDELSAREKQKIERHVQECESCAAQLQKISGLWKQEPVFPKIEADPFAWQKLYVKISARKNEALPQFGFWNQFARIAMAGGIIGLFVLGVFFGIYLGTDPRLASEANSANMLAEQEFVQMIHIDSFGDVPPGSLGSAYFSISAEVK